jgi:hypothetical protein
MSVPDRPAKVSTPAPAIGCGPTAGAASSPEDYRRATAGWGAATSGDLVLLEQPVQTDGTRVLFRMNHKDDGCHCLGCARPDGRHGLTMDIPRSAPGRRAGANNLPDRSNVWHEATSRASRAALGTRRGTGDLADLHMRATRPTGKSRARAACPARRGELGLPSPVLMPNDARILPRWSPDAPTGVPVIRIAGSSGRCTSPSRAPGRAQARLRPGPGLRSNFPSRRALSGRRPGDRSGPIHVNKLHVRRKSLSFIN